MLQSARKRRSSKNYDYQWAEDEKKRLEQNTQELKERTRATQVENIFLLTIFCLACSVSFTGGCPQESWRWWKEGEGRGWEVGMCFFIKPYKNSTIFSKAQQRKEEHDRRVQEAVTKIVKQNYVVRFCHLFCNFYRLKSRFNSHQQNTKRCALHRYNYHYRDWKWKTVLVTYEITRSKFSTYSFFLLSPSFRLTVMLSKS